MSPLPWTTRCMFSLMQVAMRRIRKQFESQVRDASQVNVNTLRALLHHNRTTLFGRRHGFASLRSVADYQRALPLSDYAFFQPDVERIARGEQGVLSADRVEYLGRTSGTTGHIKRHPITQHYLQQFQRATAISRTVVLDKVPAARHPARATLLMNARLAAPTEGGVKTGSLSAVSIHVSRDLPTARLFTSPSFVYELRKYSDALYLHLLFSLREQALGSLQAAFATAMLDMVHLLERRGSDLVEDLGRGQVRPELELDPEERRLAQSLLRPEPARAREVSAALVGGVRGMALRVWPRLAYVSCIAGASFSLYAQQLAPFLEGVAFYPANYISTEAALGIALDLDRPHYCLLPGTAFFEFIPEAQLDEAQPRVLLPEDLEQGEAYELVLTTRTGMYRYRLGDVVRLVGRYHQAPLVEVLYRRGTLLNLMGEKTSEHATQRALEQVLHSEDLHLTDYSVIEETGTFPGGYVFFIEFQGTRAEQVDGQRLGTALDAALCQTNPAYALSRSAEQLGITRVHPVRKGTFQDLRDALVRRGGSPTQVKVPRAVRDPELKALLQEHRLDPPLVSR